MAAGPSIGTARINLELNADNLDVVIGRVKQKQAGLGEAAQQEAGKMTAANRKVIKSLDDQITKLGLTREQHLQLKVMMNTEGATRDALLAKINANTAAYGREAAAIDKTTRSVEKGVNAVNQYGLTGKQQTAALRQVPAQLTDIFVSLQGGQNPLTVLFQQGGQLKDVFGGVKPAVEALYGSLVKLITPASVAAAGVAAVLLAYVQGEQRINAFNQALILTGNSSRVTADDLQAMAQSLDNIAGVTSRQGAEALTQIAANGRIAASQYQLVATAAVKMSDVTGKAVADTVAEYAELARDPVNAILKFNEAEQFLTASVYERIKALQESGDIEAAAALATETRANSQIARTDQVVASLGLVAGAWYKIKNETGEAWDEAVNYFANLDRDAAKAAGTLSRMWNAVKIGGPAGMFGLQAALSPAMQQAPDPAAAAAQEAINSAAQKQLDVIKEGNRGKQDRQALEEKQIVNLYKQLGISKEDKRVQDALAASRKAYADSLPKGPKPKSLASTANADASAQLAAIRAQYEGEQNAIQNSTKLLQAQYSARLLSAEEYYAKQRVLVESAADNEAASIQKQIDFLRARDVSGKDASNVTRQITELEMRLAKVRADSATAAAILGIQEQDLADKRKRAFDEFKEAAARETEAVIKGFDARVAAVTMGEREAAIQADLTKVYERQTEALRALNKAKADDPGMSQDEYDSRKQVIDQEARRSADAVIDGYKRMGDAQADWLNGLRTGVADWITKTSDVASQINAITNRALDGAADALTAWATGTKGTFKDLLIDIGKELTKFFMKKAVMQFLQMFMGGASSGGWGGGGGGDVMLPSGGGGPTVGPYAKGAAFALPTPSLKAYSSQVVSQPTYFQAFAKGGVMGEAGPEAIMPLQRGPDGKLGVMAHGGAANAGINLTVITNIDSNGSNTQSQGDQAAGVKQFADGIVTTVKQEIAKSTLPGGHLYKAGVRA